MEIPVLTPKTRLMIAVEFNMKPRQVTDKMNQYGFSFPKGDLMIKHQKIIYEAWGYPPCVKKEWYKDV